MLTSFPPFFGVRRRLKIPPLERIDFAAEDDCALCIHHAKGGGRGPVIIAPGQGDDRPDLLHRHSEMQSCGVPT
jgi:hypothetical protein